MDSTKQATVLRAMYRNGHPHEELSSAAMKSSSVRESITGRCIISEGSTSVDESAITGESISCRKQAGDKAVGITINKNGLHPHQSSARRSSDTTISRFTEARRRSQRQQAPHSRWPTPSLATRGRLLRHRHRLNHGISYGTSSSATAPTRPFSSTAIAVLSSPPLRLGPGNTGCHHGRPGKVLKRHPHQVRVKPETKLTPSTPSSWTRPVPLPKAARKSPTSCLTGSDEELVTLLLPP